MKKKLETLTKEEWRDMSDDEREALMHEAMQGYEDFNLFCVDCGWQDWMECYTDSLKGDSVTEDECNTINEIMRAAWNTR